MKETQAIVQNIRSLNEAYQQIELAVSEHLQNIKAGQSLLARPKALRIKKTWHPYLRSVWHPVYIHSNKMTVERPTTELYDYGDVIDLLGPIGKPHPLRQTSLRHVLMLAYDTPPIPLVMLIPELIGKQISVTLVLLGSARTYPTGHLPPEVEVIRGDNPNEPLEWPDQVTTIGLADQVFAVAAPGHETRRFSHIWDLFNMRRSEINKRYLYAVYQSVTPCGVGACDACMVNTTRGSRLACVDGPAFDMSELQFN